MTHQRTSKKITTYLFIFFTLVTISNTNLPNNFYTIKKFNINGLNAIETKQIQNELKIFKNINIFSLNKNSISKKIYSNKIVENLRISKNYPSTLNIEIKKTNFLAITKKNNSDFLVGTNGNLLKVNNNISNLPYIFGNLNVNNFLNFKKIIDNSNFKFNEIMDLYYFKSNRWDVMTKDGLTLKMPSNLTVEKLNLIFKVIQNNDFNDNKILDFRQTNMMFTNE
jgi:cell division protein FtsQ